MLYGVILAESSLTCVASPPVAPERAGEMKEEKIPSSVFLFRSQAFVGRVPMNDRASLKASLCRAFSAGCVTKCGLLSAK